MKQFTDADCLVTRDMDLSAASSITDVKSIHVSLTPKKILCFVTPCVEYLRNYINDRKIQDVYAAE